MDPSKSCRLYTSGSNYATEEVHLWRGQLRHPCHPLNKFIHLWPEKPTNYREVVGEYTREVRNMSSKILELIRDGLGLEPGYFGEELTGDQFLAINHYPRCQDPELTLPKHCDPDVMTVLLQGSVYGLQVLKDGQWLGVRPVPRALVVFVGHQLQVISNDKLKCTEHRAVINSKEARTSIASFMNPGHDTIVEPAKSMLKSGVPLYRPFKFIDFLKFFEQKKGDTKALMEVYKIKY